MGQQQLLLFPDKKYNEANCSWTQVIKTHHLEIDLDLLIKISDIMAHKSKATEKSKLNSRIK